jgi:hypothetical protein
MFFDLQFQQDKFFELLRDQIQRALPLVSDELDSPIGGKQLVDHLDCTAVELDDTPAKTITINGPNGSTTVPGNVLKVKISVAAKLAKRADVIAAGTFGVPSLTTFGLWILAEISATASSGGDIKLSVTPVELGSVIDILTPQQKAALLSKMPPVGQTIALPDVAGHPMKAANAGLTLHANTVMIRAELNAPNNATAAAWTSFYAGGAPALGGEWAIHLPTDILVDIVDDAITGAVDALPQQDPSLEIIAQPATHWGLVGPVSKATLNSVDACPVGASDISFDLDFAVMFGLAGGNIRVDVDVSWDLDDWDVFRCGVASIALPGAAVVAIGSLFGPVGAIVGVVATLVGFIVAIVEISDTAHGTLSKGVAAVDPGDMNLHAVEKDGSHVKLRGEVALGALLPGMTATKILGDLNGLLISGTLAVPAHQERSLHQVAQSPFEWGGGYSCSKSQWAPDQWDAKLVFEDPSHSPLQCAVEVLTTPASAYVIAPVWPTPQGYVTVDAHSTVTDGTAPPCELLIHTNSGVRYANLGHLAEEPAPPPPLQLAEDKIACFKQKLPGLKKWLEAIWRVDPAPDDVIHEINIWDVVASKVATGAQVELAVVDARGNARTAGTTAADARGLAEFRIATGKGEHLALSTASGEMKLWAAGAAAHEIARFVPRTRAVDVALVGTGAHARVALATNDQVLVIGLDGKTFGRAAIPGVRQVVAIGSHIAAHDGARVVAMRVSPAALAMRSAALNAPAPHAAAAPLAFTFAPTRSWTAGTEIASLAAHGSTLTATLRDGAKVALDRNLRAVVPALRAGRWFAEPWLQAPMRVGTMVARIENGAVAVYRYRATAVF